MANCTKWRHLAANLVLRGGNELILGVNCDPKRRGLEYDLARCTAALMRDDLRIDAFVILSARDENERRCPIHEVASRQ